MIALFVIVAISGKDSYAKSTLAQTTFSRARVRQRRFLNETTRDPQLSNKEKYITNVMNVNSFITSCRAQLLSDNVLSDNLLSQREYADFLYSLCNACDASTGFSGLPTSQQLSFLFAVCSSSRDFDKCLGEIMSSEKNGREFGFDTRSKVFESDIEALCASVYEDIKKDVTVSPSSLSSTSSILSSAPTPNPEVLNTTTASSPTSVQTQEPTKYATGLTSGPPYGPVTSSPTTSPLDIPTYPYIPLDLSTSFPASSTPSLSPPPMHASKNSQTEESISLMYPSSSPTQKSSMSPILNLTNDLFEELEIQNSNSSIAHKPDVFQRLFAVSITFSYRVVLSRAFSAEDIRSGRDNTISISLLTGLMKVLQVPRGRELQGLSKNGVLYGDVFVSHSLFFDISDCPAKDLGNHLCVGLLDTLAFNSSSSSQEDQALISRFLISEIESSMSPLGSYLVDQIADPDIIDIFFLGDGTKTRATISADFTSEKMHSNTLDSLPLSSLLIVGFGILVLIIAAALLAGRQLRNRRKDRRNCTHEAFNMPDGGFPISPKVPPERNIQISVFCSQFDPDTDFDLSDDTTQVVSNVSGRSVDVEKRFTFNESMSSEKAVRQDFAEREDKFHLDVKDKNQVRNVVEKIVDETSLHEVTKAPPPLGDPSELDVKSSNVRFLESSTSSANLIELKQSPGQESHKCDCKCPEVRNPEIWQPPSPVHFELASSFESSSDSESADSSSSQSSKQHGAVSTILHHQDIEALERLIENDDWEGVTCIAKRYHNRYGSVSSSSRADSSQGEIVDFLLPSKIDNLQIDRMELVDRLIEEGDWEELAKVASHIVSTKDINEGSDTNANSQCLEIGQVDLTISSESDGSSSSSSKNVVEHSEDNTKLSFLESMAENSRCDLDRSGSEGAEVAAEWAISRSLSILVDNEKNSPDFSIVKNLSSRKEV